MGRSAELIESIVKEVRKTYPTESGYKYVFEQKLYGGDLDTCPDIQIVDPAEGVVCVVEIGYTRPEKIARYRELEIPDIRCANEDGQLLSPQEREQITKVALEHGVPGEEVWREVDVGARDGIFCPECFYRTCKSIEKEFGHDEERSNYEVGRYLFTAPIYGELWSNGSRWFCVWQCDDCGECHLLTGDRLTDTIVFIWNEFEERSGFSHDKFLKRHGKEVDNLYSFQYMSIIERVMRRALYCDIKKKCSFEDLRKYVLDRYAYEIRYADVGRVPG